MSDFEIVYPKTEKEWLTLRKKVITATEVAVLLGLNKWKTIKEITESKKEPKILILDSPNIYMGQLLEPLVVSLTNKLTNSDFQLYTPYPDSLKVFFYSPTRGLGATPDAFSISGTLLECKTTKPSNALRWAYMPPSYYLIQLYTQMMAVGYDKGQLSILGTDLTQHTTHLDLELSIFSLTRDPILDKIILCEVERFWSCFQKGKSFRRQSNLTLEVEFLLLTNMRKLL